MRVGAHEELGVGLRLVDGRASFRRNIPMKIEQTTMAQFGLCTGQSQTMKTDEKQRACATHQKDLNPIQDPALTKPSFKVQRNAGAPRILGFAFVFVLATGSMWASASASTPTGISRAKESHRISIHWSRAQGSKRIKEVAVGRGQRDRGGSCKTLHKSQ